MTTKLSQSSLATIAGGFIGFAVLVSGVWHPKFPSGGHTQVGRHESVAFEDGSILDLYESQTDQDILRRRRMGGWQGQEFRQIFIAADGSEINVLNNRPGSAEESADFSSADHLLLAYHSLQTKSGESFEGAGSLLTASLQVDGKDKLLNSEIEGKDRVITNVIDGKDQVLTDAKDAKEAPVFVLANEQALIEQRLDMILMGGAFDLGSLRGPGGFSAGINTATGGTISAPPIGIAVPEPSTWTLAGVAGALALTLAAWRRRQATVKAA